MTAIDAERVHYEVSDEEAVAANSVLADSVIIATGLIGNPTLDTWKTVAGIDTTVVGDASGIGYLEGAMHDGFHAGLGLG